MHYIPNDFHHPISCFHLNLADVRIYNTQDLTVKQHAQVGYHPGSQGQGHNEVTVDHVILKSLAQRICIYTIIDEHRALHRKRL